MYSSILYFRNSGLKTRKVEETKAPVRLAKKKWKSFISFPGKSPLGSWTGIYRLAHFSPGNILGDQEIGSAKVLGRPQTIICWAALLMQETGTMTTNHSSKMPGPLSQAFCFFNCIWSSVALVSSKAFEIYCSSLYEIGFLSSHRC